MDNHELLAALTMLEKEKGINREYMFEAIETALAIAYKKSSAGMKGADIVVSMDRETANIRVYRHRPVVENGMGLEGEYDLDEAREINPEYEIGDVIVEEIDQRPFSRIAAQTAKQVVLQRIKEAERNLIYDEFSEKEHKVVVGTIQRIEKRNIYK